MATTGRILLMRHGKPAGVSRDPVKAASMAQWIAAYDGAGIDPALPGIDTLAAARYATTILSSPMPRAVASAKRIAEGREIVVMPEAFEAPLPVMGGKRLVLPPAIWLALFRIGWMCGRGEGVERPAETRRRAGRIAAILIERATTGDVPLLVGHGTLNTFIAGALRRRGWSGPRFPASGYWRHGVYTSPTNIAPQETRVNA